MSELIIFIVLVIKKEETKYLYLVSYFRTTTAFHYFVYLLASDSEQLIGAIIL